MTENEALKLGKSLYENITSNANNIIPTKEYIEFVGMAIQALEKVQALEENETYQIYREYLAIGTVEELQNMKDHLLMVKGMCKDYYEIGTIEEFKALKNTDIPTIHGKAELDLHDKEVRNKAIDDFAEAMKAMCHGITMAEKHIDNVAEQLKK